MDNSPGVHDSELRRTLHTLWRRRFTLFLSLVACVGAAVAVSMQQTPTYLGEARVIVRALPAGASSELAPVNSETEAQLVASEPVAARVAEALDLADKPSELLESLSVVAVLPTEVLRITYVSTDPVLAASIANSFAKEYLNLRTEQLIDNLKDAQNAIERQIASVQRDMEVLTQQILEQQEAGNLSLVASLEAERSSLTARLAVLQQSLDQVRPDLFESFGGGEIVQAATEPSEPYGPNHLRNGSVGLFLGLALGLVLAFVRERLDDRLRDRHDLQRSAGAPVLGMVPRVASDKVDGFRPVILADPTSQAGEAYKSVRASLQHLGMRDDLKSLLITSPGAGEGKSWTAANLALAFAQAGWRVILVSADLRRPSIESYFRVPRVPGLADWLLTRGSEVSRYVHDPRFPNLRVVPSGKPVGNPAELLGSSRLVNCIRELEDNCDLVIVDSPPVLAVSDSLVLAAEVDAVLLVVHGSSTTRSAIVHSRELLDRVGANVVGSLLNSYTHSFNDGGGYYYRYYQSVHEVDPSAPRASSV